MNANNYFQKTKKRPTKTKPRSKPLPKAKEKYLELQNDGIPFVLIVETIDTKGPDGYCPKDKI